MDCPLINKWFTLTGNLGVLVDITFLIIEIKQNIELHNSDSRKAIASNDQVSLLFALVNHDIIQTWERRKYFPNPTSIG
jgi:hypothetical protein